MQGKTLFENGCILSFFEKLFEHAHVGYCLLVWAEQFICCQTRSQFSANTIRGNERTVFPINPKRASILGIKAYPRLSALPGPIDLAVIATPAQTGHGLVAECVHWPENALRGSSVSIMRRYFWLPG